MPVLGFKIVWKELPSTGIEPLTFPQIHDVVAPSPNRYLLAILAHEDSPPILRVMVESFDTLLLLVKKDCQVRVSNHRPSSPKPRELPLGHEGM